MSYGYIVEGKSIRLRQVTRWGLTLYRAAMPPGNGIYRWHRALMWRRLYRCGVRRCIMAPFWWAEAARFGVLPVEVISLRMELLPRFLPDLTGKTVVLRADSADRNVVCAAFLLARRARYVTLDVPRGGEALRRELWRRCGLSGAGGAAAETVDFTGEVPGAVSLAGGEAEYLLNGEPIPEQAAALLWQLRRVKKEDLLVKSPPRNA